MKKKSSSELLDDDLRPEYDAELFSKMKQNRFAKVKFTLPIYLDEDVAAVFDSSEAVNTVLRSAIKAMRQAAPKRARSKRPAKRKAS